MFLVTMWISTLIATACGLVGIAIAAPSARWSRSEHVIHEKRDAFPVEWRKRDRLDPSAVLPIRIGLTQRNLHRAEEFILDVSHPDSPNFGKHWDVKKVVEMFAPSTESVDKVKSWLVSSGIEASRVKQSMGLSWLEFDGTVAEAEDLFQAEYYVYEHEEGISHLACDSYSVPEEVSSHVDIITPTLHFDSKIFPESRRKRKLASRDSSLMNKNGPVSYGTVHAPPAHADDLSTCGSLITPACLRALYEFPPGSTAHPQNSFGIPEYGQNTLFYGDLDTFFANYSPSLIGSRPIFDSIDGGVVLPDDENYAYYLEPPLDFEYAMTLVAPQKVTLYQVGTPADTANASFNTFLDAIDGSFCTFEGGDDPAFDQVYPSPNPGGWNQSAQCGVYAPAKVISTSYDYNEYYLTPAYMERQCMEYMKLGLQGVTVVFASGDFGVGGNDGHCINPVIVGAHLEGGQFAPSFPSVCPYVTSVGGTQIPYLGGVNDSEVAAESGLQSGGGFSNVFAMPSYQAPTLAKWWETYPPSYNGSLFNNSQTTRGFPDIAANGVLFSVAIIGVFTEVFGTSASTPTVGSIITLINEKRLYAGKSTVGFLNPTLYAHPEILNDITEGHNAGCGYLGFNCTPGWDPVTGLGTPNYPRMLDLYMRLP